MHFYLCNIHWHHVCVIYISGITVFTLVTLFWHIEIILQKYYIFQNQMLCVCFLLLTQHMGILRWFIHCHHRLRLRDMYVRYYTYRDQCSVSELMRK